MPYNKYAFISYQRKDSNYAKLLSWFMPLYRLPRKRRPNEFVNSKFLRPIWRDRDQLTSGDQLTPEIKAALDSSKYLIVFCSEHSLETEWVDQEVSHFLTKHDINHIIPYVLPTRGKEIRYVNSLAKAIADKQKEDDKFVFLDIRHEQEELEIGLLHRLIPWLFRLQKSYVRVIAKTLDLTFSEVWNVVNKLIRRAIRTILCILFVMFAVGLYFGVPISLPLNIKDAFPNDSLPKARNIVVKIAGAEYPILSLDTTLIIKDIPGRYRFKDIPVTICATYYKTVNTAVNPGIGLGTSRDILMQRDSTFAIYYGIVMDTNGTPVESAYVKVGHKKTTSNKNGIFRVTFDIKEQSYSKHVYIEKPGIGIKEILAECPDSSQYIIR